jgi:DNA-directed RNA polymerase specialized sigma24 family protein
MAMSDADDLLANERAAVERARHGDHDAFVQLYRQDAATAWRLALALAREPAPAEHAVVEGFRRVLAPTVMPSLRSEVPFRLRLLAATRHAVLDTSTKTPAHGDVVVEQPGPDNALPHLSDETVAAMAAFHELPERWRSVLWLLYVEGLSTGEVARVLDVRPSEADELATRARDGLLEHWARMHPDDDPTRHLAPLVPLPLGLFELAERRWRAAVDRPLGPLGLTLPGGRPLPDWAERALLMVTGLLIVAGITGALMSDSDTPSPGDGRLARGSTGGVPDRDRSSEATTVVVDEPTAYLDGDDGDATARARGTTTTTMPVIDPDTGEIVGTAAVAPTPTAEVADEPSTTTTAPPTLQVNAGVAPLLGLAIGDCTGLELLGTVLGCDPPVNDEGVTLDGSANLLGR